MAGALELVGLDGSLPLKSYQLKKHGGTDKVNRTSCKTKCITSVYNDLKVCMLYDTARVSELLTATGSANVSLDVDSRTVTSLQSSSSLSKTVCSICDQTFVSHLEQSSHFKSEWHQVNVRRQLRNCPPISEAAFSELHLDNDSSTSGSETLNSDSETDSSDERTSSASDAFIDLDESPTTGDSKNSRNQSQHIVFSNSTGEQLSVNRCLVSNILKDHDHPLSDVELCEEIKKLSVNMRWIILMASGGHFAGAVFDGSDIIQHKTFHRYVVRAKRGTCQSHCDNKGGNAPKSAGASLRRHNEAAFAQEIQDLLTSWADDLARSSRIFIRVPGHNRSLLFGGKNPVLCKTDSRLCAISVKTQRPTFREVKRVHRLLSTIRILDENSVSLNDMEIHGTDSCCVLPAPLTQNVGLGGNPVNSTQHSSNTSVLDMQSPGLVHATSRPTDSCSSVFPILSSSPADVVIESSEPEVVDMINSSTQCPSKLLDPTGSDNTRENSDDTFNKLYTACKMGSSEQVSELLQESDSECIINLQTGKQSSTLLHVASKAGHVAVVRLLLEHGADPAIRDVQNNPPYVVGSKEVKCEYRRFMADNMDLYDYIRAQIPGPLTNEMEEERKLKEAARKKAKRNAKKEKQKETKEAEKKAEQEMELKRLEESKKQAFLALSDREKRALAAEQRLRIQLARTSCSTSERCWQCGIDISGKIPFEYSDCKFCSPACLKTHRLSST